MAAKLRRLKISEVSLVAEGANPDANILFFKSLDGAPTTSTPTEGTTVFDLTTIPEALRKSVSDELGRLEGENAALTAQLAAVPATPAPIVAPVESEPVAVDKALIPVEIQKHLDLQNAEITELRKAVDIAAEEKYVTLAKSELSNIADIENVAKGLYTLAKTNATLAASLRSALSAAQAVAKTGAKVLATEIGKSNTATGSAYDKVTTLAKSKVAAGTATSFAHAMTAVLQENPELYDEYLADGA